MNSKKSNFSDKASLFLVDWGDSIIRAIFVLTFIITFFFQTCTVVGDSMLTTLHNGEKLVISNIFYSPKENDIIVFHQTGRLNEPVVKRIIATENKWVRINFDTATVYVSDDENFDESDIIDESAYAYLDTGFYRTKGIKDYYVPQGHVFVMGDNRNNSTDSRSDYIGMVDENTILGKVVFRLSPSDKLGFVN